MWGISEINDGSTTNLASFVLAELPLSSYTLHLASLKSCKVRGRFTVASNGKSYYANRPCQRYGFDLLKKLTGSGWLKQITRMSMRSLNCYLLRSWTALGSALCWMLRSELNTRTFSTRLKPASTIWSPPDTPSVQFSLQ